MTTKTKIVLDTDVIVHFEENECFGLLFDIFPEYQYLILDIVYNELIRKFPEYKTAIDNYATYFPNRLKIEKFQPTGEITREYARLILTLGRGESACMLYCLTNADVLGSSNLRDIADYCQEHNITYLTTIDFLYYAWVRGKMTEQQCKEFIQTVLDKGSKLPIVDITQYVPHAII